MTRTQSRRRNRKQGAALITTFILASLVAVAAVSYIDRSTQTIRTAQRQTMEVQTTHLCEAGVQSVLRFLWRPFKQSQRFDWMDTITLNSSVNTPTATQSGTITGVGNFAAGVVSITAPDSFSRVVTVRSVGWIDMNNNGTMESSEPQKIVEVSASYQLARSQVFDYAYFVNNYGWMNGFSANNFICNGDMRANGDFVFSNGSPTINGSVYAAMNEKLTPAAAGLVNTPPVKMTNSSYVSTYGNNPRARQAYQSSRHGTKGTSQYENWRDYIFESSASVVNQRIDGAVVADANGMAAWQRTSANGTTTRNIIDSQPTEEVIMPDLSDLSYYISLSQSYRNPKQTYGDGTANPNFNEPAYVEVWNQALNNGQGAYQRISNNGVVTGSAVLIGSSTRPIRIHGPVTFTQDAVIKGHVSGQGTIYTGRNVHVVGSVVYSNPPDFRGTSQTAIDNANEKRDILALAARGSVILGNPKTFTDQYPLQYMTPPFTKGRWDDNGNWIPPFNAKEVDSTGRMRYQSVLGDDALDAISSGVGQIDAILYTNFVGGGNIGVGGGGVQFNGSIISKDEAMVVWSLPMTMNYDSRIRERNLNSNPLIDIQLPRSPVMLRSTWRDRGFRFTR